MKQKLNYMNSIAQAYRLSLGDKFNVIYVGSDVKFGPYFLCEDGMYDTTGKEYPITLMSIVSGECFVEKIPSFAKPIKCKDGDKFRYVSNNGNIVYRYFSGRTFDCYLLQNGNMFEPDTEICQNQIDNIVKQMKGE